MIVRPTEQRYTRLTQLPEGIEFPTDLQERIAYDAEGKRLVFRGNMSRAELRRLSNLSSVASYRQALERLRMGNLPQINWTILSVGGLSVGFTLAVIYWLVR